MSTLKVKSIRHLDASTDAMVLDSDGTITGMSMANGLIDSDAINSNAITDVKLASTLDLSSKTVTGTGQVLLGQTSWTTATSSASFDVFDYTKYTHYIAYWYVNHSTAWNKTYLRFRNSSGDITSSDYYNNTSWKEAVSSGTPAHNSTSYAGQRAWAWLAGNGTNFNSHGQVLISIPSDGTGRASIRGISQLVNRTTAEHYEESFSSSLTVTNPHTALTGFSIFGSGGSSTYGDITVFGIER